MEKMSLKNIKIILISIMILLVVVMVLKLQIASTSSEKRHRQQQETQTQAQKEEAPKEETTTYFEEEPEQDNQDSSEIKTSKKKKSKTEENDNEEFYFPKSDETDNSNDTKSNEEKYIVHENEEVETSVKNEKEKDKETKIKKVVIPEAIKEKTPQEIFDYAVLEMRRGNLNSAIYEFNNAIDVAVDSNTALKARKYLAQCYERKGINSEAFDLYEYIYLETGKKDDLLELYRVAKKIKRAYTTYTYFQSYIEQHPEESESLSSYMTY